MIKAIETRYKGYRFRSRLEARWAVFFEKMGFNWRYEGQGFEANGHTYLPDFEIRNRDGDVYFAEVKGDPNAISSDRYVCEQYQAISSLLPNFINSRDHQKTALCLLGDIPDPSKGSVFFPLITESGGDLTRRWFTFVDRQSPIMAASGSCVLSMLADLFEVSDLAESPENWTVEARQIKLIRQYPKVKAALAAARAARFEHGESP